MSTTNAFHKGSNPPPPAPPLPPQRYGQRAATAIARLAHPFFYGSRPSSAQGHREAGIRNQSVLRESAPQKSSTSSSKDVSHKTGIPINALDISPERTHAVFAGRDILKTVRVSEATCSEDFNLRAHITAYASAHNASRDSGIAKHRDLTASDVKWSHKQYNTTIATAAMSGRIVIYDINRPSVEIARLHKHNRHVHKLAFNPYQGALLISGSQDGTIRMWDMRVLRGERAVLDSTSIKKFSGYSDGVRDIRWSPTDVVQFAAGTDSGVVQKWDFRKENAPLLKLNNAHEKACHTVDWHPGGRYLATAGADKQVKVWDFKSSDRRMKPSWQIRAPQSVLNARWRRDWNTGEGESESPFTTQLATSYVGRDSRIHVWDFHRPHVPFQEFDLHESPANDMLWHSADLLWSVGPSGTFVQTDMKFVPKPLDRLSTNVVTSDPEGLLLFFSDSRLKARKSHTDVEDTILRRSDANESSGERLSGSHSATDGSWDENSNSNLPHQMRRQRIADPRSVQAALHRATRETTSRENQLRDLEGLAGEALTLNPTYQADQVAATGRVLGVFDLGVFKHLARNIKLPEVTDLSNINLPATIRENFEYNASVAAQTGQYRLAQTWRIMGLATQRAIEARIAKARQNLALDDAGRSNQGDRKESIGTSRGKVCQLEEKPAGSTLQAPLQFDSTSNAATPLAKPLQGLPSVASDDESMLDPYRVHSRDSNTATFWDLREPSVAPSHNAQDDFSTEASSWIPVSPKSQSLAHANGSSGSKLPYFENVQTPDDQLEKRRAALQDYRSQPRSLVRLEEPKVGIHRPGIPLRVERHDSNESFQMFSTSAESDPRSLQYYGSFGDSQRSEASDQAAASLATSMRQDLANSYSSRQAAIMNDTRRPSVQPPPSSQPVPILDTKDSTSGNSTAVNAQIHEPVRRPSSTFLRTLHVHRANRESEEESPTCVSKGHILCLPNDLEDDSIGTPESPWGLPSLLSPLISYHLEALNDTQLPSILTLFLKPLFPYLFPDNVYTSTYIRAYHSRLTSLRLYSEATAFRKALSHAFPSLSNTLSYQPSKISWWCPTCSKPLKGEIANHCARCTERRDACSLCEMELSPDPEEIYSGISFISEHGYDSPRDKNSNFRCIKRTNRWLLCLGCGHGGHSSCLRTWWTVPASNDAKVGSLGNGMCPVQGCGHACLPGKERERSRSERDMGKKITGSKVVIRDEWVAGESKAVEGARRLAKDAKGSDRVRTASVGRRVKTKEPKDLGDSAHRSGLEGEAV